MTPLGYTVLLYLSGFVLVCLAMLPTYATKRRELKPISAMLTLIFAFSPVPFGLLSIYFARLIILAAGDDPSVLDNPFK